MRPILRAAALLLCLPASAATHTVNLSPWHGDVTPGAWSRPALDVALAQGSSLHPVITMDAGAPVLEVVLRTGGVVRFRPRGVFSVDTHAPRVRRNAFETLEQENVSLARGNGRLVLTGEHSATLRVEGTWQGVDEIFVAMGGTVKHDLLLSAAAIATLAGGDVAAEWGVELPPGTQLVRNAGGLDIVDMGGTFLARIPAPIVRDADDEHPVPGVARIELAGSARAPIARVVLQGGWAREAGRAFPILLDPTVTLEPTDTAKTGFADELDNRMNGEMVSGSLLSAGFGSDVRAFAEFPLGSIPDGSAITDVHLVVWIANHDNPTDPALPLQHDVKFVLVPTFVSTVALYNAIPPQGSGRIYYSQPLARTGADFCPAAFIEEDYDLGPLADADVASQLPLDFLTLGFTSEVGVDTFFDHIDYIGYPEEVINFVCPDPDPSTPQVEFPGTRIQLVVTYADSNVAPTCTAGGPYVSPCRDASVDGASVEDLDGDDVIYSWTSSRPDVVVSPAAGVVPGGAGAQPLPSATATLAPGTAPCGVVATLTLTVSDAAGASSTCTTTVTFDDTEAPIVVAPAPIVVECQGPAGVPSSDPVVAGWLASATASDTCAGTLTASNDAGADIPGGCSEVTVVTFTAVDECGHLGTATSTITVVDTTPPTISATGGPVACLWPPNHWYVPVTVTDISAVVTDLCGAATVQVTGCVSDQPDDAPEAGSDWNGDGNTSDDCVVGADGVLYVRSERCGSGAAAQDGRHYGIQVVAVDACGNMSAPTIAGSIHVPHDQSPHERNGCLDPTKLGTRNLP